MKESVETTFNKDLFLSLCKKYNVELSETATEPMIIIEGKLVPLISYIKGEIIWNLDQ